MQSTSAMTAGKRYSVAAFLVKTLAWVLLAAIGTLFGLALLYVSIASPPLHFVYDVLPPAGPKSVYVPGGGFVGFWYHLGYMQSLSNLEDYNFYCFSSGCLSVLLAFSNKTLTEVAQAGFSLQDAWSNGNVSQFDLVNEFFDDLVPLDVDESAMGLQNIKILVTTVEDGVQVLEPTSREELRDYIRKTTWVPYLTGRGILGDGNKTYWDGGFSRMLHPPCFHRLDLPLNWDTIVHTFNPGLSQEQVGGLYSMGQEYSRSSLIRV